MIAEHSPTMARAIRSDRPLKKELGAESYRQALAHVVLFCQSRDRDCREAVRILGDNVGRLASPVQDIRVDGAADEWHAAVPSADSRRWGPETEDRARHVWEHGFAAVIRDRSIFLFLGFEDADYFARPGHQLLVRIDCAGGPEWDHLLRVWKGDKGLTGECIYEGDTTGSHTPSRPLKRIRAASGDGVEMHIDLADCVDFSAAKPTWTLYAKARTRQGDRQYEPRTNDVPVFNESAPPGVAAGDYVRPFVFLAADVGLVPSDRTAAAIAVTSALAHAAGTDEVRRQLRKDNAALLRSARRLSYEQRVAKADYVLDEYPLEAQLAWANRCVWLGVHYLSWNRTRSLPLDLEDYTWSFIEPQTLMKLRDLAERENLVTPGIAETAKRIDKWVGAQMVNRPWVHHLPRAMERCKDDPDKYKAIKEEFEKLLALRESGGATSGQFKGEPVYEVFARNTRTYLDILERKGHFYGGCPDHAWVAQDMMRAVGIAPLAMSVSSSRQDLTGHCWPGYFAPSKRRWFSYQDSRSGQAWWYLNLDRVAVFPHAAMADRAREDKILPFPWFYREEHQGFDIKRITKEGIPTSRIRTWMLTPCF